MKYFYDDKSDSLYLSLSDRKSYHDSMEASPGVVLDYDAAGRLIGLDLEHASRTVDVSALELHAEPSASERPAVRLDGSRLRKRREELGLTQLELARMLSVSTNTIARWERGELKIEHPAMLQLALSALRGGVARKGAKRSTLSVARPSEKRSSIGQSTAPDRFKTAHKSRSVVAPSRSAKKK